MAEPREGHARSVRPGGVTSGARGTSVRGQSLGGLPGVTLMTSLSTAATSSRNPFRSFAHSSSNFSLSKSLIMSFQPMVMPRSRVHLRRQGVELKSRHDSQPGGTPRQFDKSRAQIVWESVSVAVPPPSVPSPAQLPTPAIPRPRISKPECCAECLSLWESIPTRGHLQHFSFAGAEQRYTGERNKVGRRWTIFKWAISVHF